MKTNLIIKYFEIANELEKVNIRNFKNHCYWRIANDLSVNNKWSNVVKKPFYKNATLDQLTMSCKYLQDMLNNKEKIKQYNKKSLLLRNKQKKPL